MRDLENVGIGKMSEEDRVAADSPDRNKVIDAKLEGHLSSEEWSEYQKNEVRAREDTQGS